MDIVSRNISVNMVQVDLDRVPQYPLQHSYSVRWYRPGDEELWAAIWTAAGDGHHETRLEQHQRQFAESPDQLPSRQFFLMNNSGQPVGTSTAWFDESYHGQPFGRVHWVAIVPEHQGRGLSKPLMTITCNRLRELGHERACLGTQTSRIAAINLYSEFGFVPDIRCQEDLVVWRQVQPHLKRDLVLPDAWDAG